MMSAVKFLLLFQTTILMVEFYSLFILTKLIWNQERIVQEKLTLIIDLRGC